MIQLRTVLKPADNSGAKKLMVIHLYGGFKRRTSGLGDIVLASVKAATPEGIVKKKEKVRAVIVRVRKEVRRSDGSYVRFDDNAAVVIDAKKDPRGTRVFGPVAREVKEAGFNKLVSMAKELV
ncbi:MAG: 50S ribosomal protein L14 [Patescibacteria group bacterium]